MKPSLVYLAGVVGGGATALYGWHGALVGAGTLAVAVVISIVFVLAGDRPSA